MANYTITPTLTNVKLDSFSGVINPNTNYHLPSTIDVTGATLSSYNPSSGAFQISDLTSNVTISANLLTYYSLTTTFNNLTVTSGTIPSLVDEEDTVNITFVATGGYTLPSSVTVNGYDVPVNQATATYGNCAADYSIYNNVGTLSLSQFTGNTTCVASASQPTYTVSSSLWHCTMTSILYNSVSVGSLPSTVNYGDSLSIEFTADTNYTMLNGVYSGTMGSTSLTNYFWYDSVTDTLVLTIASIEGNVSFNVASDPVSYSLSNSFTNLTITSGTVPSTVHYSDSVTITFTAASGYTLPTSVTVNGYSVPENTATATYGNCVADYGTYNGVGTLSLSEFTGNTIVSASGQSSGNTVTINADYFVNYNSIRADYSLNNGVNWIGIPREQTTLLSDVTTIKFRVWADNSIVAPELDCPALNLSLHPFDEDIYMQYMTSANYTLTNNITIVVGTYYD